MIFKHKTNIGMFFTFLGVIIFLTLREPIITETKKFLNCENQKFSVILNICHNKI